MTQTKANWEFLPNNHGSYTVTVDWTRPDGGQWSIAMNKSKGGDPGPKTDTRLSNITFTDVKPRIWYINMKEVMPSGYWSEVSYWTITVPTWTAPTPVPTPYPSPIITHTPPPATTQTGESDDIDS